MTATSWRMRSLLGGLILGSVPLGADVPSIDVASSPAQVRTVAEPTSPLTGVKLHQILDEPVPGVSWKNLPLRQVLRQTSEGYAIAALCDRRIDPTRRIELSVANVSPREILHEIAVRGSGEMRVVGNAAYLGPPEAAGLIRTLVALRTQELSSQPSRRVTALMRPHSIRWNDLATPAEILDRIVERYDLSMEGRDRVPHDLWAGGVFPEMTAAEMLSLVLIQFDLTFRWSEDRQTIQLVPLPENRAKIRIERRYPNFQQLDETLAGWKDAGRVESESLGPQTVVRGPLELHEMIDQVRLAGKTGRSTSPEKGSAAPLARRQFTLTVSRVPASAIMRKLEESGIAFEYDPAILKAAGIDLDTPVSVDVKQADAREFLSALFGPLGLRAETRGVTVTLRPERP